MHVLQKSIAVALLIGTFGLTRVSAEYSLPFSDVGEFNFSKTAISYLQQQKIMQGYADNTFRPTAPITRAEFLKILLTNQPVQTPVAISFPDVQPGDWYYGIIAQGVTKNVVQGFGDGTFRPNATITKAEAMKMLSQVWNLSTCASSAKAFDDVSQDAWYARYVATFSSCNLDPYASVSQAYPDAKLTREQAAELLFRSIISARQQTAFATSLYTVSAEGYISLNPSFGSPSSAEYTNTLSSIERERIAMLAEKKQAVVSIIAADTDENITDYLDTLASTAASSKPTLAYTVTHGTGFFINSTGQLVTNKHVVSRANSSYKIITEDGSLYDIEAIQRDPLLDLAFISIKNPEKRSFPYIPLANPSPAVIGQDTYMIGNSLGMYPGSIGKGIITGDKRVVNAINTDNTSIRLFDMIQTDAGISQGDSGGPLLDSKGRLLGISSALDQEGVSIGFAIPTRYVLAAQKSLQKYGELMKGYLGISYIHLVPKYGKDSTPTVAGALIASDSGEEAIVTGSPASRSGLQVGDLITAVNGEALSKNTYLSDLLTLYRSGETIQLDILRDTKKVTIQVTLEVRKQ